LVKERDLSLPILSLTVGLGIYLSVILAERNIIFAPSHEGLRPLLDTKMESKPASFAEAAIDDASSRVNSFSMTASAKPGEADLRGKERNEETSMRSNSSSSAQFLHSRRCSAND
jgi:hypothetical protein